MPTRPFLPKTPLQALHMTLCVVLAVSLVCSLLPAFLLARMAFASDEEADETLGALFLEAGSSSESITDANRNYSLAGVCYGVYEDESCESLFSELVLDEDGTATCEGMPAATYYVMRVGDASGYTATDAVYSVEVQAAQTSTLAIYEMPQYAQAGLVAQLLNAETQSAAAAGGASLGGATFSLSYYDCDDAQDGQTPTRAWTLASDEAGQVVLDEGHLVSGDAFYLDEDGKAVLAVGSYILEQTAPSAGYLACESPYTFSLEALAQSTEQVLASPQAGTFACQVMRADVAFAKVDDTAQVLGGVPFLLSYCNGEDAIVEQHVIVTDENGAFDSSESARDSSCNANDTAMSECPDGSFDVDEDALDAEAGVWFSMDANGTCCDPIASAGALPYGSYRLQELACSANAGALELVDVTFTLGEDGIVYELDELENELARISTSACDASDGDGYIACSGSERILDTVTYCNLVAGCSYTMSGTLHDAFTGEELLDADGEAIGASTVLCPEAASGTCSVTFELDTSELAGQRIVVFESLELDGTVIAVHEDAQDEGQTVEVLPTITTSACDAQDGDAYVTGTQATVVDTVSYVGLDTESTYKLDARLMDAETASTALDADGVALSASIEFTPEASSGSVDVEIALDTTVVGGHDIVVFERLYDADDFELASHEDIDDGAQTVKTTGIDTYATDTADADKFFTASQESVVVVSDEVSYVNLEEGELYTLVGTLVDRATGEALVEDDSDVTSTMTFRAEASSGSVTMQLEFTPCEHSLSQVVVYEELLFEGNVIASHEDSDDEDQMLTALDPEEEIVVEHVTVQSDEDAADSASAAVDTADAKRAFARLSALLALSALCVVAVVRLRMQLATTGAHSLSKRS